MSSQSFKDLVREAKTRIQECTVADVATKREQGDQFILIDTREDDEWRAGHAEGAIHIGKGILERDIEKHVSDRKAPIILYCGGGFRSALAADMLVKMGYENVISMDGGFRGWVQHGLPVTQD